MEMNITDKHGIAGILQRKFGYDCKEYYHNPNRSSKFPALAVETNGYDFMVERVRDKLQRYVGDKIPARIDIEVLGVETREIFDVTTTVVFIKVVC